MTKTTKFLTVLPVAAAVLALGGCGGSGNNDSDVPSSGGSITACFTADNTVSFSLTSSNMPSGQTLANQSTTGPMTYNGQAVTGQTFFYPSGTITSATEYWTVTNSGVTMIAMVLSNGTAEPDGTFWSQNTSPGQTATDSSGDISTFVGFETLTLAGKTFTNVCHFNAVGTTGSADQWYAPGYGMIQQVGTTGTSQYNGDI